ncbi:MAG: PIG-L family deacetylase [Cyclobacteriaceae bacterium]|nr:PIG-L family deacetylase [Cyclobacteriaceae bacterium]MDH4296001.1 PIG-L family deacetylase [Cyclobacteriaceae bacterium]MDH5248472.1 PIG-L family deacetylase [Cyclobacteriaceae bacterium]
MFIPLFALFISFRVDAQPIIADLVNPVEVSNDMRVENMAGKTILVFTPHPDDETFSMGGTLALLAKNGNRIHIIIYTNDNKGSLDLEMTSERLARIRKAEEEKACALLGIAKENIHWLGYEDGDLEYAEPRALRGTIARYIKLYRPDVVFSPDPGATWLQWHKTDHRMAANITNDAFIAAEWHLYYPEHLLVENLEPFNVREFYFYYSQQPNYEVNITSVFEEKMQAALAHVSQFEPSLSRYTPELDPRTAQGVNDRFFQLHLCNDGKCVERFRRVGK